MSEDTCAITIGKSLINPNNGEVICIGMGMCQPMRKCRKGCCDLRIDQGDPHPICYVNSDMIILNETWHLYEDGTISFKDGPPINLEKLCARIHHLEEDLYLPDGFMCSYVRRCMPIP